MTVLSSSVALGLSVLSKKALRKTATLWTVLITVQRWISPLSYYASSPPAETDKNLPVAQEWGAIFRRDGMSITIIFLSTSPVRYRDASTRS